MLRVADALGETPITMNRLIKIEKSRRLMRTLVLPVLILTVFVSACDYSPSVLTPQKLAGADWKPDKVRPWEIRPLPPSSQIDAANKSWVASNSNMIGRIYEARFSDPSRQSDFKVKHERKSSPVGNPWCTDASYRYTDPTNGSYIVRWVGLGRHDPEFLKLDTTPRLHWLAPSMSFDQIQFRDGVPVLKVIGIEGVTKFCGH